KQFLKGFSFSKEISTYCISEIARRIIKDYIKSARGAENYTAKSHHCDISTFM
ncbi:hypothetical protein ACJMK2_015549, partial [Sinanodonta woodiana]